MLRACIATQNREGTQFLGKVLSTECYTSIGGVMASAMLLEAFLDGKSVHIEQMLTTDAHGEMFRRIKLLLEGLVGSMSRAREQDWAAPLARPIDAFLQKAGDVKDTVMSGSFNFAVTHVKNVLMWGIECSNYVSSALEISSGERLEAILHDL